jgi:2-iminobutanoate/2-iminopropanoate deaminase
LRGIAQGDTFGGERLLQAFDPGDDMPETRSWQPVQSAADSPPPAGAYSPAILAGDLIFVSGQIPKDPRTGTIPDGIEAQTRQVLANLRAVLETAGASLDDVVSITAYLSDITLWDDFDRVYGQTLVAPFPTRTTVGAQLHGFLVEISAIARVAP